MNKSLSRILGLTALLVLTYAVVSVIATLSQLANGADRLLTGSGQYVFIGLLVAFVGAAATPLILYLRLPKYVAPPESASSPDFPKYQTWLLECLQQNQKLADAQLRTVDDIPAGLKVLSDVSDLAIRRAANAIFVSTAVMQNGRLDGLVMLGTQMKLVWDIASVYHLRPSPRQLLYLYSNVGASVLVAGNIDDVDFAEVASPLVASAAPSLAGALPGLQGVASLIANSLASGSANAFLTLRVGLLTKAYCAPLIHPDPNLTRKNATSQAFSMVGEIVKLNGTKVFGAMWKGVASPLSGAAQSAVGSVKAAASKANDAATAAAESVSDAVHSTTDRVKRGASVVAETTNDFGKKVGKAAESTAQTIKDGAAVAAEKSADAGRGLGRAATSGMGHLREGASSMLGSTLEAGKSIGQAATSTATKVITSSAESLDNALHSTTRGMKDGASAVSTSASKLGRVVGNAAEATTENAKVAADKVVQAANSVFGRKA